MALALSALSELQLSYAKMLNMTPGQPLLKLSPKSRWNVLLGKNVSPETAAKQEQAWNEFGSHPEVGPMFRSLRSNLTLVEKAQEEYERGPIVPKQFVMKDQQWMELIEKDESWKVVKYMAEEPRVFRAMMRKYQIPTPQEAFEHMMAKFEPVLDNLAVEAEQIDQQLVQQQVHVEKMMEDLEVFEKNLPNITINAVLEAFPEQVQVILDDIEHYRWDGMQETEDKHHH